MEIIQADVVARFNKLLGKDVFFQTGTDEHGLKNWQTAQKEGKEIMQFLDNNVSVFKKLYKKLNIDYDYFIRTTDKKIHHPGAIKLWKALVKAGDIYKKKYRGSYCAGCEAFKTEKELENGKCPNHPTREIDAVEEENYFFKLSKYKDKVAKIIKSDEYKVIPKIRKNEILSWLKEAKDISFSRPKTTLPWGIPVPEDDKQVMYVWCDALSNYITGVGYGTYEQKFKQIWPADVHIIGKDILRFHAAFWPAMLISAKIPLPKQLFVHGFMLSKGAKMSKSTGNIIEPFEQIEKYGVDQFRFYVIGAMPIDGDGEYSEDIVTEKINSELVGNLSNFCYRVLNFTNKFFNSRVGKIEKNEELIKKINEKIKKIKKKFEECNFNSAVKEILAISDLGNRYFQNNEPWKLIKEDKVKAHKIVGFSVNIVKILSILISPILPRFSSGLQEQLNLKNLTWKDIDFKFENKDIKEAKILIKKMEVEKIQEKLPLDLKVGKVLEVKDHPNADKLVVMKVDLGTEKRQIVAGIKPQYSLEDLKDKNLIIVTNLKHAKLRSVKSEGMLLAGCSDDESEIGLLTVKKSNPGDKVYFENIEHSSEEVSFDNFLKIKMVVKGGKCVYKGNVLKTDKEEVIVEKVGDGCRVR